MKRQINIAKNVGEARVEGHNVKLGRGGIREIEFFTQTQQLIAGGRDPSLRVRPTAEALAALAAAGWIADKAADELTETYWFLRAVENRLQMLRDEQTHVMPETAEGVAVIARLMGEADARAFEPAYRAALALVQGYYAELFTEGETLGAAGGGNLVFTGSDDDPATLETLSAHGLCAIRSKASATVRKWHYGGYRRDPRRGRPRPSDRTAAGAADDDRRAPAMPIEALRALRQFPVAAALRRAALRAAAQPPSCCAAAGAADGLGAAHGRGGDPPRPCHGRADRSGLCRRCQPPRGAGRQGRRLPRRRARLSGGHRPRPHHRPGAEVPDRRGPAVGHHDGRRGRASSSPRWPRRCCRSCSPPCAREFETRHGVVPGAPAGAAGLRQDGEPRDDGDAPISISSCSTTPAAPRVRTASGRWRPASISPG